MAGLLAATSCGGGSARNTDGGGADVARGSGGGGARDAATDRRMATDRASGSGGTSSTDMRQTSDAHPASDGACGALGQPCCPPGLTCQGNPATNVCGYLLIPNDYTCIHCGGLNEPCCQNAQCNGSTLACAHEGTLDTCRTCGLIGNPCCGGATGTCSDPGACCSDEPNVGLCVASGSSCYLPNTLGEGMCAAGTCECGHENEPCCGSGPFTCLEPKDRCTRAEIFNCKACGLPHNPCCANNTCASGGCCVYDPTFGGICVAAGVDCGTSPTGPATCNAGVCGTCGGLGQPCCSNLSNICTAPNTFCPSQQTSGTCQACGGKGQPCCGYDSVDTTGTDCNAGLACSSSSATTGGTCQ
jgi:hypothetical protein